MNKVKKIQKRYSNIALERRKGGKMERLLKIGMMGSVKIFKALKRVFYPKYKTVKIKIDRPAFELITVLKEVYNNINNTNITNKDYYLGLISSGLLSEFVKVKQIAAGVPIGVALNKDAYNKVFSDADREVINLISNYILTYSDDKYYMMGSDNDDEDEDTEY